MKNMIKFGMSAFVALLLMQFTYGQKSIRIDLDALGVGVVKEVQAKYGSTVLSTLKLRKEEGKAKLKFDFDGIDASKALIEFYSNGSMVTQKQVSSHGPSDPANLNFIDKRLVHKEVTELDDREEWWWGVLAVAYCCLNLEVGEDGEGETSWNVEFDCDCINVGLEVSFYGEDGTVLTLNDIDEIRIRPLNGNLGGWSAGRIALN